MNAIIKKVLLATLLVMFTAAIPLIAQTGDPKGKSMAERSEKYERMKSAKIAFITDRLRLTPEEAEKFWPVFNEFEDKKDEITRELFKDLDKRPDQAGPPTDEEADKMIRQRFSEEEALLNLKKEYYGKFQKVLNPARILLLHEAGIDCRRHILDRMDRSNESREQRQGGNARPERGIERPHPR